MWYLCLYATRGIDLRAALRGGASRDEIAAIITRGWQQPRRSRRRRRGSRSASAAPFVPIKALKQDPHLEMHTRGG